MKLSAIYICDWNSHQHMEESSQENHLDGYINLFKHWDKSYWTALNVFLLVQSILGAASSQIPDLPVHLRAGAGVVVVSVGFATAFLWIFLMNRKHSFVEAAESLIDAEMPELEDRKRSILDEGLLNQFSSSTIAGTVLPAVFAVAWIAVALLLWP